MIGIDLGWHNIRLVALQRKHRRWRLHACLDHKLTPVMHQDKRFLALACRQLLEKVPSRVRGARPEVAMALPMSDIRLHSRPLAEDVSAAEIEFIAAMEFEQRAIQDGPQLMDYRVIDRELVLLSCPRSCQDRFEALVAENGGLMHALGIDVFHILDCYVGSTNGPEANVILVDIGAAAVRLTVFCAGIPTYWRNHPRGTDPGSAAPMLARALQHYRMTGAAINISRLLVYGGGAAAVDVMQTLELFCSTCSGAPVVPEIIDPFSHLQIQAPEGVVPPGYALAFALAMQVVP